ncbi:hypothetical protein FDP41_010841 [Naegleria fowleri]|uniref:Zn(2)-C6 fungal-type domain-containing protein n=1 Tax=Naegleria fowleri TaxID=5763 RepID=A0A6A5C7K9_NAEFO|nr:uncharacterized protein FDP41_010841 [Naegleria fowleri]KAF0982862.1 hypothetical protein FDP41_010841 [Naegleria fowleri]
MNHQHAFFDDPTRPNFVQESSGASYYHQTIPNISPPVIIGSDQEELPIIINNFQQSLTKNPLAGTNFTTTHRAGLEQISNQHHHASSSLVVPQLGDSIGSTFLNFRSSNSSSTANTSSSSEDGTSAQAHICSSSSTPPSTPPNSDSNCFRTITNDGFPSTTSCNNNIIIGNLPTAQSTTNNPVALVTSSATNSKPSKRKHSTTNSNSPRHHQQQTSTLIFKPYPASTSQSHNSSKTNEHSRQLLFIEENGQTKSSNSTTDPSHFEISCVSCRVKHRKCDKKLPTCSYCALRGIECVYRKPRKKGRQGKSFLHEDYEDQFELDDQKTKEDIIEDQQVSNTTINNNITNTGLLNQQQQQQELILQQQQQQLLMQQPTSGAFNNVLNNFGLFSLNPPQLESQLQPSLQSQLESQLFSLLNQPPQPQQFLIPSNTSLLDVNQFSMNANPLPTYNPEDWLYQIRSSLRNNDETNNVNTLHSLLTSDSISTLFQLSNMVEDPNTNNVRTTNTNITTTSSSATTIANDPNVSIDVITEQLMKRLTLEDYCKSTSFPLIDEQSVSHLLRNEKKQAEASALLYSIHSLMCQRKGLKAEAESAHQKAKSILSTVFNTYENFLVACSYCNLSMYCSGEGNLEDARFFLHFVDYYFDQAEQNTATDHIVHVNTYHLKMLKHVAEMACGMAVKDSESSSRSLLDSSTNEEHSDKNDIGNLLIGFYKMCSGAKQAPKPLLEIVSKTITTDTVKLYLTLLELVSKLFYQHETNRNLKDEQGQMSSRVRMALNHGIRLLVLQECGITSDPMLEESANALIDIACEDKFGAAYPIMLSAVAAACRVHLKVIKEIEQGKRQNLGGDGVDYYEMIKKGLKVLTIFSTRFGRVNKLYSPLILELQEVERNHIKAKLCLLVGSEIERLKLLKAQPSSMTMSSDSQQHLLSFLTKEDILTIYYLVPPSIQDSPHK